MSLPCQQCTNPRECLYMCRVSGQNDPNCDNCIVNKILGEKEETIRGLKNEVIKHKDKSNKYDEMVKLLSEELTKTVVKVFLNTLGK